MIQEIIDRLDDIELVEVVKFKTNYSHPIFTIKKSIIVDQIQHMVHKLNEASAKYLRETHTMLPNLLYMTSDVFFVLYSCGYINLKFGEGELVGTLLNRYKVYMDNRNKKSTIVLGIDKGDNTKIDIIKRFDLVNE